MENTLAQHLQILNQIHDIEKKSEKLEKNSINRNTRRIKGIYEEMGLTTHNPLGESYKETRTDCEATISGTSTEELVITEVIKPIIMQKVDGFARIVQKGIVIVEGK